MEKPVEYKQHYLNDYRIIDQKSKSNFDIVDPDEQLPRD